MRCPHCGLRITRCSVARGIGWTFGMLLAAGALRVIHRQAENHVPPRVRIGDIAPRMNFSTVRVEGVLADDARRLRDGGVFFAIDDGSGLLPVFLDTAPAVRLPHAGSRVAVTGSLSVGEGFQIRMKVASADRLAVLDPPVQPSTNGLAAVSSAMERERMVVRGRVIRTWEPPPDSTAPRKLVLQDDSGTAEVVYWLDAALAVAVGDEVEVRGTVSAYKGEAQLRLWRADDVRVME